MVLKGSMPLEAETHTFDNPLVCLRGTGGTMLLLSD